MAAPDKFRGTAAAPQVAAAIARAARAVGLPCRELPLADGGEGTLDVFGGANRSATVTGPLGAPVPAGWRLDGHRAVIEMAAASGLLLAGGAAGNDPVAATTRGTGELILAAVAAGATDILIGVGGSATTDGGAGALQVLAPDGGPSVLPDGVRLRVCADVRTRFLDAAAIFGPQKGADPDTVRLLTERLAELRVRYRERFGVDVQTLDRSGAAGGLSGGLAAIGAELVDGFGTLADAAGWDDALAYADLVITGEGRFDAQSLDGKVVGGVIERAVARGCAVLVVAGSADPAVVVPRGVTVTALVDRFGTAAAFGDTTGCITRAVTDHLLRDPLRPADRG
jgi:glycerate kinase